MSTKAGNLRMISGPNLWVFAALVLTLELSGCGSTGPAPVYDGFGPPPAGYYRVHRGDTLYGIAKRHRVSYEMLARWNNLTPPYRIYAGALLRVEPPLGKSRSSRPKRTQTVKATKNPAKQTITKRTTSGKASSVVRKSSGGGSAKVASGLRWQWPLQGKVVQRFRGGDRTRQGIRIAGGPGQKVLAAEGGTVVYSGSGLKGYGNLIIIKHNSSYLSAYGFNRRLMVNEGARVKRGQSVAEVGQASNGEYRLHFEIRKSGTAVDPLKYLP